MTSTELSVARTMFETMMGDATASGEATTIDEMRAAYDTMCAKLEIPSDVQITEVVIAGVPCIDVRATDGEPDRTIVWLHSGGYAIGSPAGYRSLGAHLSAASGARVVLVDYRLAPENPFPAALDDAAAVYRAIVAEQDGGAGRCVLAGDSAGGGLVMATLVKIRDAGDELPSCAVCCSPWVDLAQTGDSLDSNAAIDPAVSRGMLEMCTAMYLGEGDRYNPLASPLYADLARLPPLFVLVGTAETLLDDARRLSDRATAAGVDVTLRVADGMIHIFPLFVSFLPEAKEAVAEIGDFIRSHAKKLA